MGVPTKTLFKQEKIVKNLYISVFSKLFQQSGGIEHGHEYQRRGVRGRGKRRWYTPPNIKCIQYEMSKLLAV